MQRKILFFFTATFPYGKGEAFIESEMPFLAAHFDKIIIVSNTHTGEKRNIPENVEIEYFPYELSFFEKIAALKNLNTLLFKEEKSIIKNRYTSDFSKITRNILLTSIYKAEKLRKFIGKLEKLYVKKEDYLNAKSAYESALKITPNDTEVLKSLKNLDALGTLKLDFGRQKI